MNEHTIPVERLRELERKEKLYDALEPLLRELVEIRLNPQGFSHEELNSFCTKAANTATKIADIMREGE